MTSKHFHNLFGEKPRDPEAEELTAFHMDMAASIQSVTEEIVLKIVAAMVEEYGVKNICLAGGVALNCVANGKILKSGLVDRLWAQPASGDAGGAIDAQLYWHKQMHNSRIPPKDDGMKVLILGPPLLTTL